MDDIDYSEDNLPVTKNPWWKAKIISFSAFILFLLFVALLTAWLFHYILNRNAAPPVGGVPTPTSSSSAIPTARVPASPTE